MISLKLDLVNLPASTLFFPIKLLFPLFYFISLNLNVHKVNSYGKKKSFPCKSLLFPFQFLVLLDDKLLFEVVYIMD